MTVKTVSTEPECEHLFLDRFIGLGIGWYDVCKKCGAEFVRVQDEPGSKDWHYEKLEDDPSSPAEAEKEIKMAAAAGDNVDDAIRALSSPMTPISTDRRFCALLDDLDPFSCSRETLDYLAGEAPDQFSAGFLAGVADFRRQLAAITGRDF